MNMKVQLTKVAKIDVVKSTRKVSKMDFAMRCYCFEFELLEAIHPVSNNLPHFRFRVSRVDYCT